MLLCGREMYKERVGGEAYTRWAARYPEERRMVQSRLVQITFSDITTCNLS